MSLMKQGIDISFAQGLDTKTDPKRVPVGNFVSLENTIFEKGGLLQKRNGYAQLTSLPNTSSSYLTTFNGNLTAVGKNITAYNESNQTWVTKGNIQPMSVSTLPLIRNNLNQTSVDAAVSPNGLVCTVYIESNGTTLVNKYAVADAVTGQNIIAPTVIPVASGTVNGGMRVYCLGTNFVILFTNLISGTSHLQYVAVSTSNPSVVTANTDIAAAYVPTTGLSWDAYIAGENLYIAYNTTTPSQRIIVTYLTNRLTTVTPVVFNGQKANVMSVTTDISNPSNPYVYVSYYNASTGVTSALVLDNNLNTVMSPILITNGVAVVSITSVAQNGTGTFFVEVNNNYSFDSTVPTHFIDKVTITPVFSQFSSVFSSGVSTITVSSTTGLVSGMTLVDNTTASNILGGTTFTISGSTLTLSNPTTGSSAASPGDALGAVSISSVITSIRSVGLASKAFTSPITTSNPYPTFDKIPNASAVTAGTQIYVVENNKSYVSNGAIWSATNVIYYLSAYQSQYQPTYFLINGSLSTSASPVVSGKLAYSNGGGYVTTGIPNVTSNGTISQVPYLYKDLIAAVNKNTNVASGTQTAGIYSQTGINLGSFQIDSQNLDTAEVGGDLHLSGGFLWMYDGYLPVEHNFFLWPDTDQTNPTDTALFANTSLSPTGTASSGSNVITLSSVSGIVIGMQITDQTNPGRIASGTIVTGISGSTITISQNTLGTISGDTLLIIAFLQAKPDGATNTNAYYYQFVYEWTDNTGNAFRSAPSIPIPVTTTNGTANGTVTLNIPTLRLTYKTANPVKIVIYRWSVAQQIYYQVTSITSPLLNDTTTDSVTYVDISSDAQILGNNILYTTGGVVEDVNAPASNLLTLFDTRLWLVDAEDKNLLWFSKQVIEATPVEMSDLFTIYVAPTTAAQGSTGPITAIAPMDDKLIIFKQNAIYYINGTGPDNTGANNQYSQPIFITSTVGCANQQSIVFMPQGLMFQSNKGIWLLDRSLNTSYIGAAVEKYNTGVVESAQNIPATNQVRFILSTGITLMYDYFYGQWGTFTGVAAISSCIYGALHTFINGYGQVFQESVGTFLDGSSPVLMSFTTGPIRLGDLQNYQRAYSFYLLGTYITPHKLLVGISYDYSGVPEQSDLLAPANYSTPYGSGASQSPYGQGNPYGGPSSLEHFRIFLQRQRCMAIAISLQEVFDATLGVPAGAGLTLSGINVVLGFKSKWSTIAATKSYG
jgi:hypothetical protein